MSKKEDKYKDLYKVLLKRELTKEEKLARSALLAMSDEESES